jgi:hypothetical protein
VHLRDYFLHGNLDSNPYLIQGAVVHVPYVDFNQPWAEVRRDSSVVFAQLMPGESAIEALLKSTGYRPALAYKAVLVTEKKGGMTLLTHAEANRYVPHDGAIIEAVSVSHDIFVGGAVQKPGLQAYLPERMVAQYISQAGLLHTSRVSKSVQVIRADGMRERLNLNSQDLQPGDLVLVDQNAEQRFLLYTPILLSIVSLALVYVQIQSL